MEQPLPLQPLGTTTNRIPRKPLLAPNSASVSVSQQDESPPGKPNKRKWKLRYKACIPKHAWASEIASVVLAFAMLAAIVVLLTIRQDKPLPDWPSLLGINSLVAIFSSVFKVALLYPVVEGISELKWIWFATAKSVNDFDSFDSASRGPWGAAKLLAKHPSNIFASLGAFIMVLSLAIDPFTQQVLRFYNCQIAIDGSTATIARTNSYTAVTGAGEGSIADPKLTGAVYQGLLNPPANATVDMSTFCPSGNCTFSHSGGVVYSSLEICSYVSDISQSVKGSADGLGSNDASWNYSLPSGLNITYDNSSQVALASWMPSNAWEPGFVQNDTTIVLSYLEVLMITTDCSDPFTTAGSRQCSIKPLAVTIVVAPCVVQYGNVSISNSIFRETAISSMILPSPVGIDSFSIGISSSFPNTDCSGSKTRHGNKTTKTSMYLDVGGNATYRCPEPAVCQDRGNVHGNDTLWYDPACIFHLGYGAVFGLTSVLRQVFRPNSDAPYNLWLQEWPYTYQLDLQQWLAPLWASGHANLSSVSKTMESLTGTLNTVIRAEGDQSAPARGVIQSNQTCVGVKWAWFALPCGLLMLTLVFLLSTMIISHRKVKHGAIEEGRKPWKSSTLPLLWCGIQDTTRARFGRLDDVDQMEKCGEGVEVALGRENGDRWKLIGRRFDVAGNRL